MLVLPNTGPSTNATMNYPTYEYSAALYPVQTYWHHHQRPYPIIQEEPEYQGQITLRDLERVLPHCRG